MTIEKLRNTLKGCIVQRSSDGKFLCKDGSWRNGCAHKYKFYRRMNSAVKYGLKGESGSAYAVYYGDEIDIHDDIVRFGDINITEVADGVTEYKYFSRRARAGRNADGKWIVNYGDTHRANYKICTSCDDANYNARKFAATGRVV